MAIKCIKLLLLSLAVILVWPFPASAEKTVHNFFYWLGVGWLITSITDYFLVLPRNVSITITHGSVSEDSDDD